MLKDSWLPRKKIPELDEYALYEKIIPVDDKGRCILSEQVGKEKTRMIVLRRKCNELCKALTDEEIQNILNIKKVFERPLEEVRAFLYEVYSGCTMIVLCLHLKLCSAYQVIGAR